MSYSDKFEKFIKKQQEKFRKVIDGNTRNPIIWSHCKVDQHHYALNDNYTALIIPSEFLIFDKNIFRQKQHKSDVVKFLLKDTSGYYEALEYSDDALDEKKFVTFYGNGNGVLVTVRKSLIRDFLKQGCCFEIKNEVSPVMVWLEDELIALVMPVRRKEVN